MRVHHLVHVGGCRRAAGGRGPCGSELLERQAPRCSMRPLERARHGVDERVMARLAVERVEAVAEAAQPDRVERQRASCRAATSTSSSGFSRSHFSTSCSAMSSIIGVVALHRALAEVRAAGCCAPSTSSAPRVRGEQPVAREVRSDAAARRARSCRSASRRRARRPASSPTRRRRLAHHVEPVDRPVLAREPDVLDGRGRAEREQVAEHGVRGGWGIGSSGLRLGMGGPPS